MKKTLVFMNILYLLGLAFSLFAALMSPFLFDAPGSEHNTLLITAFISILIWPVSFLLAISFSLYFFFRKHKPKAAFIALSLPLICLLIIISCFAGIDLFCHGNFACSR